MTAPQHGLMHGIIPYPQPLPMPMPGALHSAPFVFMGIEVETRKRKRGPRQWTDVHIYILVMVQRPVAHANTSASMGSHFCMYDCTNNISPL